MDDMDKMDQVNDMNEPPKSPIPKLPFIIGGVVAAVAVIVILSVALTRIMDDGNGNDGPAHEHSFGEWQTVDAPTCTAAGIEERVCECGINEMRRADPSGHTVVVEQAVASTCDKPGRTEGKHCSVCGAVLLESVEVARAPHTYSNDADIDCNVCGEIRNIDVSCAHTETETVAGKAATCTEAGLTDGQKCKKCGEILIAQQIVPVLAHTYDNKYDEDCNVCGYKRDAECAHQDTEIIKGSAATCTSVGLTDGQKCKKCGEVLVVQTVIPKVAHTEVTIPSREATCTSGGLTAGVKCSVCGAILVSQQETPSAPHVYDDKYDESCNECGAVRDTECSHRDIETLLGYAASCTSEGRTDGQKCKKCGETIVAQTTIPMKPHAEVIDAAVEATCTSTGLTEGKHCADCGKVLVAQNVTDMKPHAEVIDAAVEATCTSTGLTEGKHCADCDKVLVAQSVTDMKPHSEGDWVVDKEATATESGSKHQECAVCGETLKTEVIEATGSLGLAYKVNSGGTTCTITGIGNCTDTDVIIPAVIDGYEVTKIGEEAFNNCYYLKSISIPDSVTWIGYHAFYNDYSYYGKLTSVYITDIEAWLNISFVWDSSNPCCYGADLYLNGEKLTELVVPDTITKINAWAFYGCRSLTSVTIPNSVTRIGGDAFGECSSLTNITIPFVGATKDGKAATHFGHIFGAGDYSENDKFVPSSLRTVTITGGSSIENYAFIRCASLRSVIIPDSVKSIGKYAFFDCCFLESIVIPDGVMSIGECAFGYCSALASVNIPDSVKSIGESAFSKCRSLASVIIPDSVTSIGYRAFENCSSLASINVDEENSNYLSIDGNLYGKNGKTLIQYAMGKKDTLFTIPDFVTSVGGHAFSGCGSLTSVIIPDSVTWIGEWAFSDCKSLTSVVISDSVTSIEWCLFYRCYSLTSITIPDSVTRIKDSAFCDCGSLTQIYFKGTKEQWNTVKKVSGWNEDTGNYTIYCTDGNIGK